MILFSIFKAENPGKSEDELCELAGIDPQLPSRWARKYGTLYLEWLDEAEDQSVLDDAKVLERVGMMQAVQPGNYQYWRDMAKSKGVIKEEVREQKITINTDFSAILLAGGSFDEARARILETHRGMGNAIGSGMAAPPRVGEPEGAGVGARPLQARPVALAHALGADGGRAEQREPLPAVPEQDTFAGSYVVLDEGEVSTSAEKSPDDGDLAF